MLYNLNKYDIFSIALEKIFSKHSIIKFEWESMKGRTSIFFNCSASFFSIVCVILIKTININILSIIYFLKE